MYLEVARKHVYIICYMFWYLYENRLHHVSTLTMMSGHLTEYNEFANLQNLQKKYH